MITIDEIIDISLPVFLILLVLILFVRISSRLRKSGGSMTSVLFGSTFELHNQDRRKAAEVIVEERSGKKQKEQDSGEANGDGNGNEESGSRMQEAEYRS